MVAGTAYGVLGMTTLPLLFRVFKPQPRRKADDVSTRKPHLAIALVEELVALGFRFSGVLAASRYGERGAFTSALHRLGLHRLGLHRLGLQYAVAIRSNHSGWLLPGQRVRQTRWRPFERVFTDGSTEQRFIRETLYGTRHPIRSYQITTDRSPPIP